MLKLLMLTQLKKRLTKLKKHQKRLLLLILKTFHNNADSGETDDNHYDKEYVNEHFIDISKYTIISDQEDNKVVLSQDEDYMIIKSKKIIVVEDDGKEKE